MKVLFLHVGKAPKSRLLDGWSGTISLLEDSGVRECLFPLWSFTCSNPPPPPPLLSSELSVIWGRGTPGRAGFLLCLWLAGRLVDEGVEEGGVEGLESSGTSMLILGVRVPPLVKESGLRIWGGKRGRKGERKRGRQFVIIMNKWM